MLEISDGKAIAITKKMALTMILAVTEGSKKLKTVSDVTTMNARSEKGHSPVC